MIIEQMILLVLILSRWLLPKGELTREELSQLLLVSRSHDSRGEYPNRLGVHRDCSGYCGILRSIQRGSSRGEKKPSLLIFIDF